MKDLPFAHCGIVKSSIVIEDDEVSYKLDDGRDVSCPKQGGVWIDGPTIQRQQVSGTCDTPFRFVKKKAMEMLAEPAVVGRPSVGTKTLPGLTVPENLRTALEAKAAELGLSVPDARREAYRLFTK